MPDHPLDTIFANGVAVQKALVKAEFKKYARDFVNAATFRTYDLPGVTIAIISGKLYLYDPADLTTPDDGTLCIHDASSRRFKLQTASIAGSTLFTASSVAGTNAVTANTDGMPTPSATKRYVMIVFVNDNTGAMTITFDGGSALDLEIDGAAIPTGTIIAGKRYLLEVTSTDVQFALSGLNI
jgi:hypothetical protein